MGSENFYFEKASAESASPESIRLDVKSSVIFSSGCFVKAFAFQRLNFSAKVFSASLVLGEGEKVLN